MFEQIKQVELGLVEDVDERKKEMATFFGRIRGVRSSEGTLPPRPDQYTRPTTVAPPPQEPPDAGLQDWDMFVVDARSFLGECCRICMFRMLRGCGFGSF